MTFGLVNVSFSLPKWQGVKMTFFAPCHAKAGGHMAANLVDHVRGTSEG